jgi:pyridinium-3,5-biscarboxylic acid mononucleotide sulfurtransferase
MEAYMEPNARSAARTPDERLHDLERALRGFGSVCIGYSGGVDSVFLARVAVDTLGAARVLAVTGRSPTYPLVQWRTATECAARFGIPHLELDTHELANPDYAANPSNRCYFCKSELWPKLIAVARERGFDVVLDGSNLDDADDHRPGARAAREHGVRSPLQDAGLTKADIRTLSRRMGLPTWDQPSAPCLASRLPYGVAVTSERLRQVEEAEAMLRALGYREFRVRHHVDCARVELAPAELPRAWAHASELARSVGSIGVDRVLLDVEGYRRGALNEALVQLGQAAGPAPRHETRVVPTHDVAGYHRDIAVVADRTLAAARAAVAPLRALGFRYIAVDARA